MGTISDKLMRIINTKEDIRQALISKGYDVPTSIPFKEYAKMISDLPCRVDSFPDIEGIVARYSALGLTNEQMAANPVWVDKTGNWHDLQMKNFAWKGMSGVGGYVTNKDIYEYDLDRYSYTFIENGAKVHDFYIVFELIGYDENFKDGFNLDVRSISQGLKYRKTYTKNGIYIFQYKDEEGLDDLFAIGYNGNGGARSNFTVKILPLYSGALVFDGVDDYGTCDNFPVLTKEKGYTVVALRKWLTPETKTINEVLLGNFKNNPIWTSANLGAFQFEVKYNVSKKVQTGSFGIGNNITLNNNHLFSYQISNSYNGSILRLGSDVGGNFFTVGCGGDQFYANAAIWELVFLDHDATEEELTKIKDYFVKTYPWLFPDQAWTVTGKTNEDEDRATIANITGNGNDLVLSNFGFAEGSGYNEEGEYAGYLVTDGVDDKITSLNAFKLNTNWSIVGDWGFIEDEKSLSGLAKINQIYIYNVVGGSWFFVKKGDTGKVIPIKFINYIDCKGLVYDKNFNQYQVDVGDNVDIDYSLFLAGLSNDFTKIAFKNLAIFPKVLSKEDCIKAYNYLQTLKAK